MAHLALRAAGLLAAATFLALSTSAAPQSTRLDTANVDVLQGRAVLLGGDSEAETIRRGESKEATGRSQLEITAGSQARIAWRGTCSVHVWGPASLEWQSNDGSLALTFHELSWADVEARAGQHELVLPADWHGTFGRSSFHLRGLSGGPSELRLHAGNAVVLDWRGDESSVRPPVAIYPGSSVRLDRPRFQRVEVAQGRSRGAWSEKDTRGENEGWPWRERADTEQQARERVTLSRETQTFDEMPGTPGGDIGQIRTYEADGSSQVAPIRRRNRAAATSQPETYSQVPVTPVRPRVEVQTREPGASTLSRSRTTTMPQRGERVPTPRPGTPVRTAPSTRANGNAAPNASSGSATPTTRSESTRQRPSMPKMSAEGRSMDLERSRSADAESRASRAVRTRTFKFDALQWRGFDLSDLNGTGEIAAERGSGVEVRVLGQGRTKVFVSTGAPSPRWCFTPTMDLLMHPGSVAVFEADGTLRMSFGKTEENEPVAGRPSYAALAD